MEPAPVHRRAGGRRRRRPEPGHRQLQPGGAGDLPPLHGGGDRRRPHPGRGGALLFPGGTPQREVRPGPVRQHAGAHLPHQGGLRRGQPAARNGLHRLYPEVPGGARGVQKRQLQRPGPGGGVHHGPCGAVRRPAGPVRPGGLFGRGAPVRDVRHRPDGVQKLRPAQARRAAAGLSHRQLYVRQTGVPLRLRRRAARAPCSPSSPGNTATGPCAASSAPPWTTRWRG